MTAMVPELFNMLTDSNETNDLSGDEPGITRRLRSAALAWRRSLPTLSAEAPSTHFEATFPKN